MKKRRSCFGYLIRVVLLAIVIVVGAVTAIGYYDYRTALDECPLPEKVAEVRNNENFTPLAEMGDYFPAMIVTVEDKRFYEHGALDIFSFSRAIATNVRTMSLAEGGSTITQQVAKNLYFTMEKRFTRKVAEAFMAINLERNYTKDEILELYCNSIFYGNHCNTIKEAAATYFDKEPASLTFEEAAMLAGIPQAPSVYNPLADQEKAAARYEAVMKILDENGVTP